MRAITTGMIAAVLTVLALHPGWATETDQITGQDIVDLLTDKTAIGEWNGDTYRQYFDASGTTYYAPRGKRSSRGKWRVSDDGLSYESWWNGADSNWEAYGIRREGRGFTWVAPNGTTYPFLLLDGQQLVWRD